MPNIPSLLPRAILALAFVASAPSFALPDSHESIIPARRASPTKTENGFLAFPIYTHVPGIGSTFGFGLMANNLASTRTNALGAIAGGDMSAAAFGITEVHLVPNNVVMNFYAYSTAIPFQLFERGGESGANQHVNLLRREYGATAELNLHFWERRIQLNSMVAPSRLRVASARTPDRAILDNRDTNEYPTLSTTLRFQLDLTDDDQDPRRGLKLQVIRHQSDVFDGWHSRYASVSGMATLFVPVGRASTWAFNVFRSSAEVLERNTASIDQLRERLGFNCSGVADPQTRATCESSEDLRVRERFNQNRYGTAALLGGPTQLRGYPVGRMRGSQTLFYASEFRWNVTDEATNFDFGFIRGARSLLQIAPFYELGAASDPPNSVESAKLHAVYGVGFRMGFSGALVRADVGIGEEGPQFTFFFGYPWDLSIL